MSRVLSERQELELLQIVVDNRYEYTGDEWYKDLSKEIEKKLHPEKYKKWWKG